VTVNGKRTLKSAIADFYFFILFKKIKKDKKANSLNGENCIQSLYFVHITNFLKFGEIIVIIVYSVKITFSSKHYTDILSSYSKTILLNSCFFAMDGHILSFHQDSSSKVVV